MNRTGIKLTGNFRFRSGFRNRLVLQIEESYQYDDSQGGLPSPKFSNFRDAKVEDLQFLPASLVMKGENNDG